MAHPPGTRLGPYEIVGSLGAGGMGDVYKARDTRLERTVALKVSKQAFEERFRNEALAVASLNHPHICTLFDVGPDYLVMEHVEGKTLHGPLPVAEVLRLALQIADALEHAHRHGIVHRDLKPSNILVTKQGVKVLDFGLAKRLPRGLECKDEPTLTAEGAILGTPTYMAPEQIEGKPADERSDIFAFGLVLYEMLTGERAFDGESAAAVAAAILEREPARISALQPTTPAAVEDVVLTCLAKDPAERWQSVRELKHALAWASRPGPRVARGIRPWPVMAVIGALLALGAGLAIARRGTQPAKPLPVQLQVALPPKARFELISTLAVSPDGRQLAFAVTLPGQPPQVFLRPLDSVAATPLRGAQKGTMPFWSPDSRQVGFFDTAGAGLKKVGLSGGPAQTLCRCGTGQGATWGSQDVIIVSTLGRLVRVPAAGGDPAPLGSLAEGETGRYWPQFLPDGRHYIYLSLSSRMEDRGIYVGALDSDLRKRIVATENTAAYSAPGYLLFVRDKMLMAQPFDAQRLELSGAPHQVLEGLLLLPGTVTAGLAQFSVSTNGVLAWRPVSPPDPRQLTWFDRSGQKVGMVGEPGDYFAPALSPGERSVAVCRTETGTGRDVWIFDVPTGTSRRLTFDPHDDCGQVWSPDGKKIAFFSDRRGVREIYQKWADGSGDDELLLASKDYALHVEDWSTDGRFIVFNSPRPGHDKDLFLLPMSSSGAGEPISLVATEVMETEANIAPSGRWIAYMSMESGAAEVYVRDLSPEGKPGPGKWQVSQGGGFQPRWRPDGKELFFYGMVGMMAAPVKTDGSTFEAGVPRAIGVTLGDDVGPFEVDRFHVTRDGQRFLMNARLKPPEPIRILVNWLP
jgi:Tol biopolymer transport system component